MTTRFRIADLRDENCDRDVYHAETSTWNEERQKATYGHDAPGCALCALLNVVEAARRVAEERTGHELGGEHPLYVKLVTLDEALDRFDFG